MRIELTKDQGDELLNAFWHIPYGTVTDSAGVETELFTDYDDLRDIPEAYIGELGQVTDKDGNVLGYAMDHPLLTWEDEILLKAPLDDRVAAMDSIKALPPKNRSDARRDLQTRLRVEARTNDRGAERVALRQSDKQAARQEFRQELQKDPRIAERIATRLAAEEKLAAEDTPG